MVTSTWPRAHSVLYLHHRLPRGCTCMHFGENQLSPRSVGISPLSTSPPLVLQHQWVRASTECHLRFTLLMDSSRGFGSHRGYLRPVQTRLPSGCPALRLVNLCNRDALAGSFYKRHAISRLLRPVAAGKYEVSGSVSFPSRGAFHLSLTVLVHYRLHGVGGLGGWSPQLPTSLLVARGTQVLPAARRPQPYGTLTGLWWCIPAPSGPAYVRHQGSPTTPPGSCPPSGLGPARFARHYYGRLG